MGRDPECLVSRDDLLRALFYLNVIQSGVTKPPLARGLSEDKDHAGPAQSQEDKTRRIGFGTASLCKRAARSVTLNETRHTQQCH